MDTSIEQSHKSIGFKLFGNIAFSSEARELVVDLNQTYEIQFFPGEIPVGTLTHLEKHDEKKIVVELPQEIRQNSFEKICSFLLEKDSHLVVKECGYEKLGNRKLLLELSYDSKDPIVNVVIFIQGRWNSVDYEIELNPYDISCSVGEIQKHNSKEYRKAHIIMEELKNIKKCDIKKVFPKLKPNNFHVSIDRDRIIIDLGSPLQQFMNSLGKPTKYQNIRKTEKSYLQDVVPDEIVYPPADEISSLPKDKKSSSVWPLFRKMIGKG
jgi:hypothetical protein